MLKISLNGRILPQDDACVSALDWGVLYGYGLYETMKAVDGVVFRLGRHLARMRNAAEEIKLPVPWGDGEIKSMIDELLTANNLSDAYVRLTITRGRGEPALKYTGEVNPNIIIITRSLPQGIEEKKEKGVTAAVTLKHVRCTGDIRCRVKTTNYLMNALAKLDAEEQGVDELILLNEKGNVAEFSSANIFLAEDGRLTTPPLDSGILAGITREAVLEVAGDLGIETIEQNITPAELQTADEVFKTGAIQGVIPVVKVDGKPVGDGKPGKITQKLQKTYKKLVEKECVGK